MNIDAVLTAISFGFLSFFLKRFVDKFDKFEDYTRKNNKELDKYLGKMEARLLLIEKQVVKGVSVASLDEISKKYLQTIVDQIKQFNSKAQKMEEDYGTVIWLKDEIRKQNDKIVALFKVSKELHLKQVQQGQRDAQQHSVPPGKKSGS